MNKRNYRKYVKKTQLGIWVEKDIKKFIQERYNNFNQFVTDAMSEKLERSEHYQDFKGLQTVLDYELKNKRCKND